MLPYQKAYFCDIAGTEVIKSLQQPSKNSDVQGPASCDEMVICSDFKYL